MCLLVTVKNKVTLFSEANLSPHHMHLQTAALSDHTAQAAPAIRQSCNPTDEDLSRPHGD